MASKIHVWTTRISAANNDWRSVCWSPELSLFCAVAYSGTGNRVMTSPDGITWTIRTSAVDNLWRSVCWSPELSLFCAVASNGTDNSVMTSPDGVTWTLRTSAANNSWYSVCWSPERTLFCAVATSGTGNRVMTSSDGITWTIRTSAVDNNWFSVCWSSELSLFCAVANGGTGNGIMTSHNGIDWTTRIPAADNTWNSICWSPELSLFCAVAYSGTGNSVMTSPDGITWTIRTPAIDNTWRSVCWSPELMLFCAVASGVGDKVITSPDGVTWTTHAPAAYNAWYSVCWSPELSLFCAVAISGTNSRVMTGYVKVEFTSVDILNSALIALGEITVLAMSATTKAGRLALNIFDDKRDYLLRKHRWTFAAKRKNIAPDVETPSHQYAHQFTLPFDCLHFRGIYPNTITYRLEGNKILCDEDELDIEYTRRVTDPNDMDTTFREVLSALLARELAISLCDSMRKRDRMDEMFEDKIADARFSDSIYDDLEEIQANDWLNERI